MKLMVIFLSFDMIIWPVQSPLIAYNQRSSLPPVHKPYSLTSGAIKHILEGHESEGVTMLHIAKLHEYLARPMMILKSESTNPNNRGYPLFVTDEFISINVREGGSYKTISTPLVIALRPTEDGNEVVTVFPWKPYLQGGRSIVDAIQDGYLLAYNKKKTEALVPSTNRLRVEDLIQKASDKTRIIKLDALVKSENEGLLKVSNAVKEDQRQAVKTALEHNEYPSDEVLRQFAGDPDVDWEMRFRRIIRQDPKITEMFNETYDDLTEKDDGKAPDTDTVENAFTKDAEPNWEYL